MADGSQIMSSMQSLPVRQMLRDLAMGIADAQGQLDAASLRALREAAKTKIKVGDNDEETLLNLGLIPTFYQFREATIDLSFSMSTHVEESKSLGIQADVTVTRDQSS